MEVEFSGCIQKSGAETLNRNISDKYIQVRQTIFSAFERRQSGHSFWFFNCWDGLQTLRQNFARVVSLAALNLVSKQARAPLTQSCPRWYKVATQENRNNGNFVLFFEFLVRHQVNNPWKCVQCYVILSENLIQEFSLSYGGLVPLEVCRS